MEEEKAENDGERRTSEGERRTSGGERKTSGGERKTSEGERRTSEGERRTSEGERKTSEGERRKSEPEPEPTNIEDTEEPDPSAELREPEVPDEAEPVEGDAPLAEETPEEPIIEEQAEIPEEVQPEIPEEAEPPLSPPREYSDEDVTSPEEEEEHEAAPDVSPYLPYQEIGGEDDLGHRMKGQEDMVPEEAMDMDHPPITEDPTFRACLDNEQIRTVHMESFCCQQIKIPPLLPHILKSYTKSAIRTQPRDLLRWSAAYFRAMANGEPPPVKDRLEYPTVESSYGLTKGLLRVLNKQLGKLPTVSEADLEDKWIGICLDRSELQKLLELHVLADTDGINWIHFIAAASTSITNEHMIEAMIVFCETLTEQPDGVDPYVPYEVFAEGYTFLAERQGIAVDTAEDACCFLRALSKANFGLIAPKDFMAPECPPLF